MTGAVLCMHYCDSIALQVCESLEVLQLLSVTNAFVADQKAALRAGIALVLLESALAPPEGH